MYRGPELTQGFVDESIMAPKGQPIEYTGKPFTGVLAPKGLEVGEATQEEWDEAVEKAREHQN